jgi:hypothetical protein
MGVRFDKEDYSVNLARVAKYNVLAGSTDDDIMVSAASIVLHTRLSSHTFLSSCIQMHIGVSTADIDGNVKFDMSAGMYMEDEKDITVQARVKIDSSSDYVQVNGQIGCKFDTDSTDNLVGAFGVLDGARPTDIQMEMSLNGTNMADSTHAFALAGGVFMEGPGEIRMNGVLADKLRLHGLMGLKLDTDSDYAENSMSGWLGYMPGFQNRQNEWLTDIALFDVHGRNKYTDNFQYGVLHGCDGDEIQLHGSVIATDLTTSRGTSDDNSWALAGGVFSKGLEDITMNGVAKQLVDSNNGYTAETKIQSLLVSGLQAQTV